MSKEIELGWHYFLKLCQQFDSQDELNRFFDFILTHEEQIDISKRMLTIKELLQESMTQRELAAAFNISISKITRGSNALKQCDPKLKETLSQAFNPKKAGER